MTTTTLSRADLEQQVTLSNLISTYHLIEERLEESEGEITPDIDAMLSAFGDALNVKLDCYAGLLSSLKASIEFLSTERRRLQSREQSLSRAIDRLRERMVWAMQEVGETKIKTQLHTMSLRATESWAVDDEVLTAGELDELIAHNIAERSYKINLAVLKARIKESGEAVPEYIRVAEKTSITIR